MSWWTDWESNPARVACKASLRPGGRPNESASPRVLMSNTSAFTRVVWKWCSDVVSSHALLLFRQALSPDYLSERAACENRTRVIGVALRGPANRPRPHGGCPENRTRHAHRRRFYRPAQSPDLATPDWLQRTESNGLPRGYEPRELPMLHAASRVRGLNSIACRQYIRGQQNLADSRGLDPQCLAASIPLRTGARHSPR